MSNLHWHLEPADSNSPIEGVGGQSKPITDLSIRDYEFVNDVNAKASWLLHRAEITQMLKQEPFPTQLRISVVGFGRISDDCLEMKDLDLEEQLLLWPRLPGWLGFQTFRHT